MSFTVVSKLGVTKLKIVNEYFGIMQVTGLNYFGCKVISYKKVFADKIPPF